MHIKQAETVGQFAADRPGIHTGIPEENARRRDREANRVGCRHGAVALSVQALGFTTGRSRRGRAAAKVSRQAAMTLGNAIHLLLIQAAYFQKHSHELHHTGSNHEKGKE